MMEPMTNVELEAALDAINCVVFDDNERFFARNRQTGSTTRLEAEDYSSALFEAWNLMKP